MMTCTVHHSPPLRQTLHDESRQRQRRHGTFEPVEPSHPALLRSTRRRSSIPCSSDPMTPCRAPATKRPIHNLWVTSANQSTAARSLQPCLVPNTRCRHLSLHAATSSSDFSTTETPRLRRLKGLPLPLPQHNPQRLCSSPSSAERK